jgi:allantoicase
LSSQPLPPELAHLTNLAEDSTGTFVVSATDDFFAPKENLLRPDAPVWKEGLYTDRGKWMDGWESMRKREPGHDHCTIRLGTPGSIEGLLVDTTHFKGNAPQAVWLEVCEAPFTATAATLDQAHWNLVLERSPIRADHPNVLWLPGASPRATHVRLHIDPDGGVARLRVLGRVMPDPHVFWGPESVDLVAIENGGRTAAVSDQFFGPPSNLTLPGRGVNMGDGWETRRRRSPGTDWCVLELGRRGEIERIEIDTHYFKGNAPQSTIIEALDASSLSPEEREPQTFAELLRGREAWTELVGRSPLVQHRRHSLRPERPMAVTHLRVHIDPHGGVNRLRAWGRALATETEAARLSQLHDPQVPELRELLRSFNGSRAWVEGMLASAPHPRPAHLFSAAEVIWWSLSESDWLEAFAAHPRIGQSKAAPSQSPQSASWSQGEQRGMSSAAEQLRAEMAELNVLYFARFGFIYIVCASGRSADELLALLRSRVGRSRDQELEQAAREQARITRLRIERWLTSP